jgi:dethiobiotin synthetase
MTIVVTGTDTDIGKTVFAAALAGALGAHYWKPVQAGLDDGSDRERAARLQDAGFDVRGIRPPTVPAGTARLRVSLTLNVSEADVDALAISLAEALA